MNYAEEAALWYLRLNGFFPISNFVIHAAAAIEHTTDCDILAVRPPFVFEEVGGQADDWDPFLTGHLDFQHPVGIICQVKSGGFDVNDLFRVEPLRYAVARLGLVQPPKLDDALDHLKRSSTVILAEGTQIAKLLVARNEREGPFLMKGLTGVEQFLRDRVAKYPKQKYRDRMFFGPVLFQTIIELAVGGDGVARV